MLEYFNETVKEHVRRCLEERLRKALDDPCSALGAMVAEVRPVAQPLLALIGPRWASSASHRGLTRSRLFPAGAARQAAASLAAAAAERGQAEGDLAGVQGQA